MTDPTKRGLLATLLVLAFVAPGTVAYALWSGTSTATVSVSIAAPSSSSPTAPAAPTLACGSRQNNSEFSMSWTSPAGASAYDVYRAASNTDASYGVVAAGAGSPYAASLADGETFYFRIKARNASGPSPFSNTIKVVRQGNGNGNFTCTSVTP